MLMLMVYTQFSLNMHVVSCATYRLASRVRTGGSSAFTCNHCSHKGCDHVATLREWRELNGLNEEVAGQVLGVEDESYTAMSSQKIPYQEGTYQHGNRCRINP